MDFYPLFCPNLVACFEAMARGSYEAFAQKFQCEGLEHLHPEDRWSYPGNRRVGRSRTRWLGKGPGTVKKKTLRVGKVKDRVISQGKR